MTEGACRSVWRAAELPVRRCLGILEGSPPRQLTMQIAPSFGFGACDRRVRACIRFSRRHRQMIPKEDGAVTRLWQTPIRSTGFLAFTDGSEVPDSARKLIAARGQAGWFADQAPFDCFKKMWDEDFHESAFDTIIEEANAPRRFVSGFLLVEAWSDTSGSH